MVKGKFVLVPFPSDALFSAKVRPAFCLTEPVDSYRRVVLGFITSQIPVALLESYLLWDEGDVDFVAAGLQVGSTIRLHRMMTVSMTMIRCDIV